MTGRRRAREFDAWYREFHARLVTVLAAAIGDADLAQDAADEALARAWRHWRRVSEMASAEGWTYRVALNLAHRRRRQRAIEQRVLQRREPGAVSGPTGELWLVVAALPARQREAVLLRHVGHLTEREIAAVMGVTRATVSTTLRAAYARLAKDLRVDEIENGSIP